MKKKLGLFLVAAVALSIFTGCGSSTAPKSDAKATTTSDKKFVVAYSNLADTDVFAMSRKEAFNAKTKNDPKLEVRFTDATSDINKQLDQICFLGEFARHNKALYYSV